MKKELLKVLGQLSKAQLSEEDLASAYGVTEILRLTYERNPKIPRAALIMHMEWLEEARKNEG